MSKPRLIILSDIFGSSNETWMDEYRALLEPHFNCIEYDCRELAGIAHLHQESMHEGFASGGIEHAVDNLLNREINDAHILGFSVGGTIGWKFALKTKNVLSITLISATRLRYETRVPQSENVIYFGELEEFGPQSEWFEAMEITPKWIARGGHDCYKDLNVIKQVCKHLIEKYGYQGVF